MPTRRLTRAKAEDKETILSSFASMLSPADLDPSLEEGMCFIYKEGPALVAVAALSRSVEDTLFPKTHSARKASDLLDEIGFRGEPLALVRSLLVLPEKQGRGIGSEFFVSLLAQFKTATWFVPLSSSQISAYRFFQHFGFILLPARSDIESDEEGLHCLLARKYVPSGLCREAFW